MSPDPNTMAALDFARELSTAKNPPEAASLWSSHVRKQFEILTEQSKELAALSQNIVASSTEPITRSFGKPLQGS